ncbi:MazG family protein [Ruicaihuangia caeni]|uniref:MazG family protein n=1 Tax=Ruicaihuangia caeni TaxID=3042517 RepID=UPI00338FF30E
MTQDRVTPLDSLLLQFPRMLDPEGGCVWNRQQTHRSLVPYLIEEVYELVEAIETGDRDGMLEELGDVLYQLVFHAELAASEPGEGFDLQDVARAVTDKMVRRHPHVFADVSAPTVERVLEVWNEAKSAEKRERRSVLEGVPRALPALALADKLLGRAARVGIDPVRSPSERLGTDAAAPTAEAELGDALLALVATARERGLDAEQVLRDRLRELEAEIAGAESPTT